MEAVRRFIGSRFGRLSLAGAILLALSAPAFAEHFDFDNPPTSGDLGVDCTNALDEAACDEAVAGVMEDLEGYLHPENHGKYVSFLAHCLKGMKGKGEMMSQVAQASGNEAEELAVKLCAEYKLEQAAEDTDTESSVHGKGSGDDNETEDVDSEDSEGVKGHNNKGGKGRGGHHHEGS